MFKEVRYLVVNFAADYGEENVVGEDAEEEKYYAY